MVPGIAFLAFLSFLGPLHGSVGLWVMKQVFMEESDC